ncbi:MAG: vanadium-dependent haloperoxidase [Bacteroidota bacterium]|nr:vanadium-dependent haloperoxidase [Bacteroidota bacterium]
MIKNLFCIIFISLSFSINADGQWESKTENARYIHRAIKEATDVMVYDIYSPPVTSRTYAYISVAAYETLIHEKSGYLSLAGQLHGLQTLPAPEAGKKYSFTLAAVKAILTVAKSLVISENKIADFETTIEKEFLVDGIPQQVYDNSVAYGLQVADHILAWAAKDNYKQLRSLSQYAVTNDEGSWKPTPPAYIRAIEPNWNKLRTFIIDSAQQFKPERPPSFSKDTSSAFYKIAFAVYEKGKDNSANEISVSNFWDCNPFKMNVRGHVMYATKKISPNGHWMNITRIICEKAHADPIQSAEAYACIAVTMADCFISCWDEKYRSVLIRPETYINRYIDVAWVPVLQTPPFPEYTSGHSIVSAGASVVLTKLFGNNFSYTDSTESEFGLPPRNFSSFNAAAHEAAISRFYGGIHYMPAIKNGFIAGDAIGKLIVQKLKMKKE